MTDDRTEEFRDPMPDRPPTPAEERAAEEGSRDVDTDRVEEHFREMTERGAHVQGEGQIEGQPDADLHDDLDAQRENPSD
jgi:hypothetical protein